MPRGIWSKKGLEAVKSKRGKRAEVKTAPQAVLDKYLVKPTEAEVNEMADSLYDETGKINPNKLWEKEPGIYAKAVALYEAQRKAGVEEGATTPAKP
jgi:hypothetical protein